MFPPLTSTLSLDVNLLRYNHPKLLQIFKKRKRSKLSREYRRYRRLIKTFLTTLAAEVLRERLRHAAEDCGKSLESYLLEHQWNILKATGANQIIIDLIYPRVSESLKLSTWGPLLTCLVLKAVKCLTDDEIADVKVIEKMCRRYILKYKCGRHKCLDRVKRDWGTIYTSSQKLADSAKTTKLVKSIRNYNDEVALQRESKNKRPYSAPVRTSKKSDSIKTGSIRRPATSNSAREKMSLVSSTSSRSWLDIVRQHQQNYGAPKQLLTPISLHEISIPDKEIMENNNETIKTREHVNDRKNPKSAKMNMKAKTGDNKNLERSAQEHRLRQLSGRLLLPVQIPRNFIDIKPAKRPVRLKPLKMAPMVTRKERVLGPQSVRMAPRPKSEPLPPTVTKTVSRTNREPNPWKARAKSDTVQGSQQEKSRGLMAASVDKLPEANSTSMDQIKKKQVATAKEGFTKKEIKDLVKAAITLLHIEDVATNSLFHKTDFIDAVFQHLEKTNKTDKFLHAQNYEEHEIFRKVDGSKVQFSFLHYCVYNHAKYHTPVNDIQEYLLKQVLNALACNHGDGQDSEICCWKCKQKSLAMEVAIDSGNMDTSTLLLQEGVPYKEEHLQVCVKVENIVIFKQVIAELKMNKTWNPTSSCVREALYLARYKEFKQFVKILEAEGVGNNRARYVACLPCFL